MTTDEFGQGYDAGHADGYAEGRREADVTGHLLRPHALHLLQIVRQVQPRDDGCITCAEIRTVLEDLLP